jgi:hypothetical protein
MTAFLDIAEAGQRKTAPLRGNQVDIRGISARQIAAILVEHASVQQFLDGTPVNILQLLKLAPDAVAVAIAYGTGHEPDPLYGGDKAKFDQAVIRATQLAGGEQYDLLLAIFDVTFGERLNPFVKALAGRLGTALASDGGDQQPPATRPPRSLKELRDSLRSGTTNAMFGDTRPDKSPPSADSPSAAAVAS